MKRSLLERLRTNGICYVIAALLLIVGIPLLQALLLNPQGFALALDTTGTGRFAAYLSWINEHRALFLLYRATLLIAFALLLTLPLSLYRIIVAQELLGQQERAAEAGDHDDEHDADDNEEATEEHEPIPEGMPAYAWRGKGFAILAVWGGLLGLGVYVLGTLASTLYFAIASSHAPAEATVASYSNIFTISTSTVGIGLLGLSTLFFGAMITRTGRNLWPGIWVAFGYAALLVGALLCISAVAVVSAPGAGQGTLTTVATVLFALWILWLGIMLTRLKAEG